MICYLFLLPLIFLILYPIFKLLNINDSWKFHPYIILYYILGIKHNVKNKYKLINKGYVLCNHRSFFDFPHDAYISDSSVLSRRAAALISGIATIYYHYILRRMVIFKRGSINRKELFIKMKDNLKFNNRIMFYPEGTRNNYKILHSKEDIKKKLKYGLLKSIYNDKCLPVQLCISSNKEKVVNEKKLSANYGVTVNTEFSDAIHPINFEKFDDFIDKISDKWYKLWLNTHKNIT